MATVTTTGRAKKTRPPAPPTPDGILQLGLCFWGSKTLLSAIELGLFSELAKGPPLTEVFGWMWQIRAVVGVRPNVTKRPNKSPKNELLREIQAGRGGNLHTIYIVRKYFTQ
jgi:hypothetical protein